MCIILANSVFVHIPKTGGSWVRKTLNLNGLIIEKKAQHEKRPNGQNLFAFVRNPISWYRSKWSYTTRITPNRMSYLGKHFENEDELQRDNFLTWFNKIPPKAFEKAMQKWLGRNLNRIKIIGKTENLQEDLANIIKKYEGFDLQLFPKKQNVSRAKRKEIAIYTEKEIKKIIKHNERFMTKFGYSLKQEDYLHYLT